MSLLGRASAAVTFAAVVLAPALAWACPSCAGRNDGGGVAALYLLGSMILLPFAIAAVVVRVIRRAEADEPLLSDSGTQP